jgi:hypothetical protein
MDKIAKYPVTEAPRKTQVLFLFPLFSDTIKTQNRKAQPPDAIKPLHT